MKLISFALFIMLAATDQLSAQSLKSLDTITDTKNEPFDQICFQKIYRKRRFISDGDFVSTGFLIAPNVVLTAAHNLYSTYWTRVSNIIIYPGRYQDQYSYDTLEISGETLCQNTIVVHPDFRWNRVNFDFGIIVIPDSLIKKTKHWPTKSCFTLDKNYQLKNGDIISVAGFPANPDSGYNGSLMTYEVLRCGNVLNHKFSHKFRTQTGNSGSPVWIEKDGERKIAGIHTYAEAGTIISKEYIQMILNWVEQKKASLKSISKSNY